MRVLHLVDRWSVRGGAYQHLAGIVDEQRRAGVELAVAAGLQEAAAPIALHVVPGLECRNRQHADLDPVIAAFRPDVVHVHTVVNPAVLEWAAARSSVVTVQDHRYFCPSRGKWTLAGKPCRDALRSDVCASCFEDAGYFRDVYALTEQRLAAVRRMRVVTLSHYVAAELRQAGVPGPAVTTIPPFVHGLSPSPADGPPCVAIIGRLTESKGVEDAVVAWRRSGTALPLVAAGTGPLRSWLEAQGVQITGWLDRPGLSSVLGRARAVLLTPRWQEPFGIAGLEAMTLGVPVAAWESGGIAEWHPGPLASWGDADAVAERLRAVLRDGPVPEAARAQLRERHSPVGLMARLAGGYERAVGLP